MAHLLARINPKQPKIQHLPPLLVVILHYAQGSLFKSLTGRGKKKKGKEKRAT
jgi:ribosomal protein L15E